MDQTSIPLPKITWHQVSYLGRAIKIVWESGRRWTFSLWMLSILQSVLPVLRLYVMKLLLDAISQGYADKTLTNFKTVIPLIVAMGVINISGALMSGASRLVNELQSQRVSDYMFEIMHDQAAAVDLEYYENAEYYDILERARSEGSNVPLKLSNRIKGVLSDAIQLITMGGVLFIF
ncbi:MAG: ABC transporter ATP-binding protein [Coleofasciculaceae cyanobacterium RL_1_1]|nr:ABC transporter ATP-binding protein [Coleofasciculaceae cyanobacterium RL_1_1]